MHFTGSNLNPPSPRWWGPVVLCLTEQDSTVLRFNFLAQVPSENILRAGKILRNAILSRAPHMIRDRKYHLKTYRLADILN